MDSKTRIELLDRAAKAFSPSAPIDQEALFSGRLGQMRDVMNAINQKGQHVVLYGERGVGKTSLAKVISMFNRASAIVPPSINCDPSMSFEGLWRKIFREIGLAGSEANFGFVGEPGLLGAKLEYLLPEDPKPDDVRYVLQKLGKTIIVIDELDRLQDRSATALLSDTIKTLSDHAVNTTLILVGVADSVDNLLSEHASIERALVQIRMPRMSREELFEIIDKGLKTIGFTMEDMAKERIAVLSQGLPHFTHLLALHSVQAAIIKDHLAVTEVDLGMAIEKALSQAQQSIISAYHNATNSSRENSLYKQVLLACALARTDGLGTFSATDVRGPMSKIMQKTYDIPAFSQHLNAFCEPVRGPILKKGGTARRFRFRFTNPLMQPYVIMEGLRTHLITEDDLSNGASC